ncbi:hypothetical protein ABZP36_025796 [Zizania latifolia]
MERRIPHFPYHPRGSGAAPPALRRPRALTRPFRRPSLLPLLLPASSMVAAPKPLPRCLAALLTNVQETGAGGGNSVRRVRRFSGAALGLGGYGRGPVPRLDRLVLPAAIAAFTMNP